MSVTAGKQWGRYVINITIVKIIMGMLLQVKSVYP